MPKAATRQADKPIVTGAMHGDKPRQRTVPANQAEPLFNRQAESVFALAGALTGKLGSNRGGRRARLPQLDLSALEVRTDLHPARLPGGHGKGLTRWDAVFAKLTADGQCIPVPMPYRAALGKAATAYAKNHREQLAGSRLRVLTIDRDTAGVFRVPAKAAA